MSGDTTTPAKRRATYLQHADLMLLQAWAVEVRVMFRGAMPYLVGSATERRDWRDVDVRLIVADEHHARLKKRLNVQTLGLAMSLWGQRVTGLPIDFQVQQMTAANEAHHKPRHPLAMPREEYDA